MNQVVAGDHLNQVVAADHERAKAFYTRVLGLQLVGEDPFAVVFDLSGTMLRISTVPGHQGAVYTVLGWAVDDIAATVHDWSPPGGLTRVAWFLDPDGNNLSLTQF